jgi:hypothetical protein
MAHTISIDFITSNSDKVIKSFQHNLRLTKTKSSLNDKSYWVNSDGSLSKISDNKLSKTNKEIYKIIRDNNQKWIDDDKLKISRSDDRFPSGRKKAWSDLKHQVIGEGVIWFGAGFELEETKLDDIKKFRESNYTEKENDGVVYKSPSKSDKSKILEQAIANVKKYFKDLNAEEPTNFVLHSDEKGQSHLHFSYRNSDLETGRGLDLQFGRNGVRSQTMIAENMNQFNIVRGIPKSKNKGASVKKENHHQYRMTQELTDNLISDKSDPELLAKWGIYWMKNKELIIQELEYQQNFDVIKATLISELQANIQKIEDSDIDDDGSKAESMFDSITDLTSAKTAKQLYSQGSKVNRKLKAITRGTRPR